MPLVATMLEPEYHTFEGPNAGKVRSAGRAVFNADVVIMDAEDVPVESGEVGEICVRGPMVMQGYWRQPELARKVLRGGWMHTGDAGYLDDDGFLFLVDRIKDMIITGGENVYSAAVENVIYQYAGVHECAVIGIPSEQWGEAVHPIVVMQEGAVLDTDRLVEHCREISLAPKEVLFNEDDLENAMYLILEGELEVFKGPKQIAILGPGQYLGEMSLIESKARSASARVGHSRPPCSLKSMKNISIAIWRQNPRRSSLLCAHCQAAYAMIWKR